MECIIYSPLVLVAFLLAIYASGESILTIDPPGPVVVFNSSLKGVTTLNETDEDEVKENYLNNTFKPIILTCKSTGNYNITWDVPDFNFGELANQKVIPL